MILTRQMIKVNKNLKKDLLIKTTDLACQNMLKAQLKKIQLENFAIKKQNYRIVEKYKRMLNLVATIHEELET